MFICQYCGKECKSKLSKSCHERVCKLNLNKVDTTYLSQNANNTNEKIRQKYKEIKDNLKIIKFERVCENCGNTFYIEDVENRKHFPKCCSSYCAHSLSGKINSNGIKKIKCIKCNKEYEVNKHRNPNNFVCEECKNIDKKIKENNKIKDKKQIIKKEKLNIKEKHTRFLSEESLQKLREAGKKSAKKQAEIRRSKNEIEFCRLCEEHFNNVEHNKPIFNGWDADVIIHDIKYAILWNGKVHYEPIFGQANFNRVINRDKIKIHEIKKANYIPYIIKDIGKLNNNFVKEKFDEFLEYLKENS